MVSAVDAGGTQIGFVLTCDVSGDPAPVITWYRGGQQLSGETGKTLTIEPPISDDDATVSGVDYFCTASSSTFGTIRSRTATVRRSCRSLPVCVLYVGTMPTCAPMYVRMYSILSHFLSEHDVRISTLSASVIMLHTYVCTYVLTSTYMHVKCFNYSTYVYSMCMYVDQYMHSFMYVLLWHVCIVFHSIPHSPVGDRRVHCDRC